MNFLRNRTLTSSLCALLLCGLTLTACHKDLPDDEPPLIPPENSATESLTETSESESESESESTPSDEELLAHFEYTLSRGEYTLTGVKDKTQTTYTIPTCVSAIAASAFADCVNLTELTIPDTVTSIAKNAFDGCVGLIQNESGLSYVDRWVIGCDVKTEAPVFRADTVGIADSAFENCKALKTLILPKSIQHIGFYVFDGANAIEHAEIPASAIFGLPKTALKSVVITSGSSVESFAFYNCQTLTSVAIGAEVTNIGEKAFGNCGELTSVTFASSGALRIIGLNAFEKCTKLQRLSLPNSVTKISANAFSGCSALTEINVPASVTSIGYSAFDKCAAVEWDEKNDVGYVGNWAVIRSRPENVVLRDGTVGIIDNLFYEYSRLKSITLPDSLAYIGDLSFYNCYGLSKAVGGVGLKNIGEQAFYGCYSLFSITVPKTIQRLNVSSFYESGVIQKDRGLGYIDHFVVSLYSTSEWVVTRPGIVGIAEGAFASTQNLKILYFNGSAEEWNSLVIHANNAGLNSVTVYFYSEEKPADSSRAWHYVDGLPTPWDAE